MHAITLHVNGTTHRVVVDPIAPLLRVLRDELGLTGTKEGCGTGYCGACTVLIEELPVNSCLYFAVDADNKRVTTIEGLSQDGSLSPVQQAFVDNGGLQCGYCTPGMVVATQALLDDTPDPSPEQIRSALAGNICRCTGYQSIVKSVRAAAGAVGRSEAANETKRGRTPVRSRA
ncbi:MAG TPA: (2Fe-2S)-binding protein [Candidatus Eremiobacteraceae bacterium]|nr:(2Fe-2S)-binding protein [Candidatus Eremiobacteraceae bacterium]